MLPWLLRRIPISMSHSTSHFATSGPLRHHSIFVVTMSTNGRNQFDSRRGIPLHLRFQLSPPNRSGSLRPGGGQVVFLPVSGPPRVAGDNSYRNCSGCQFSHALCSDVTAAEVSLQWGRGYYTPGNGPPGTSFGGGSYSLSSECSSGSGLFMCHFYGFHPSRTT